MSESECVGVGLGVSVAAGLVAGYQRAGVVG